jgi:hypothetical protein
VAQRESGEAVWDTGRVQSGRMTHAHAIVYIPKRFRRMYGDPAILEDNYPAMRAHARFMIGRAGRTSLLGKPIRGPDRDYVYNAGQGFGEWLEPHDVHVESVWSPCGTWPGPGRRRARRTYRTP